MEGGLNKIESTEKEPVPFATIFIVRHGDTEYKEEFSDPGSENDLTEKGKMQIQDLAERINNEIQEQDKVYIMMSPRVRAQNSAQIIEDALNQHGHEVIRLGGGRQSLSNVEMLDKEKTNIYKKQGDKEKYLSDMTEVLGRLKQESDYYLKSRMGTLENPTTQDIQEYRGKVETFLKRIIEIARQRKGGNEKLALITHGEWLDTVLELYLAHSIRENKDLTEKGEAIKVEVLADKLKFYFRNQEVVVNI